MDNYKKFLDIGIFSIQNGKFQDGIENINKSLEIKSDWEIPYFYRGVAYQALEKFDDAILDYTKALSFNNKMADAYYNRAYIMLTRKDLENIDYNKVIADLEQALNLDNNFIDALYAMAAAKMKVEKYSESLEFLERLLFIQPDSINAKALKKLLLTKYIK
ncbi:MAG: tetratricopeptide repeat protein [bacterium]|nr:tetratricopeptide repeat protein [bacterium]